jgi:ribosome-associated translation inhibitor RaiA
MRKPLEVCLRHLDDEDHEKVEQTIRERAGRLGRFADDIVGCQVTVDRPQRSQTSHNPYRVLIRLTVPPNQQLVVSLQPVDLHGSSAEVVHEAFDTMERQLDACSDRRRRSVKGHSLPKAPRMLPTP